MSSTHAFRWYSRKGAVLAEGMVLFVIGEDLFRERADAGEAVRRMIASFCIRPFAKRFRDRAGERRRAASPRKLREVERREKTVPSGTTAARTRPRRRPGAAFDDAEAFEELWARSRSPGRTPRSRMPSMISFNVTIA